MKQVEESVNAVLLTFALILGLSDIILIIYLAAQATS